MPLVLRSVTRSIRPSGVKDTWAGSAPGSLSGRESGQNRQLRP